jgi:lactoylglutathione lyase
LIAHTDLSRNQLRDMLQSGQLTMAGNRRLKIYGMLTCGSGKRMKKENRVFFHDARQAEEEGFRPCGHCMPAGYRRWRMSQQRQHMTLEHAAIWTKNLERLKGYYARYFGGKANEKYVNPAKQFESYFLTFASGARLELMYQPDIPANANDTARRQHLGFIHLAFGVETRAEVDAKADELRAARFPILSGPRVTGDGYYEFETLDPDNNRLEVTCRA